MVVISLDGPTGADDDLPPWKTILRNSRRVYTPSQRVSGKVVLDLEEDKKVEKVLITFSGVIKTCIATGTSGNKRYHEYTCTMFSFSKQLFEGGEYKLRATKYEWPFSFQFPEFFNPNKADLDAVRQGFTVGRQPLPPSCRSESPTGNTRGEIIYRLQAVIPKPYLDERAEAILNFTPVRLETMPHSMHASQKQIEMEHDQKFRFDAVGPRSLTMKESLKDKFHSHTDTKCFNFSVEVSAPTVVVLGKPYPIFVTLKSTTNEEVVPEVKLDSIEAHFKAFTNIRSGGTFGDYVEDTECSVPLLSSNEGLNFKLPLNEAAPITGIFPKNISIPPTFSTISIYRNYRLTVHLRLRCLDDTYKSSCKWPTIMLLPAKMEEGVEEAVQLIENGNFGILDDAALATGENVPTYAPPISEDVSPPTYNMAQKSS